MWKIVLLVEFSVLVAKSSLIVNSMNNKENSFEVLLQEIVMKAVKPFNCVAIVADPIYIDFFEKFWFRRFGSLLSFFVINLNDNYDSQNDTEAYLTLAKNDGCQMYIILISVGDQVADLLRFGDKYRLLDSSSQYIILYDNQLFEKNLLYIWKRLINVVFIRRNRGKRAKNDTKKEPWYELSTVPFPAYFTQILVPRRLDIWAKLKFRKGTNLFKDKTSDLKNETLRVAVFPHIPGTVKTEITTNKMFTKLDKNETSVDYIEDQPQYFFRGAEVEIIQTISKVMNFQIKIYEPENASTELWGRNINGNFTGILGEMTSARADLALGDLYYIPLILDVMDLSIPYNVECLTFLTPESLTNVSWKTLIMPFSKIMWTCVLLCLLVSAIVFHYISIFHKYINKREHEDRKNNKNKQFETEYRKRNIINFGLESQLGNVDGDMKYSLMKEQMQPSKQEDQPEGLYQFSEPINSILYTYSMLLMVSLPKLPTGWSLRMLTGWYWLYCLLVVVAYRASMTAILARPSPRVTIDSFKTLIDSKLSYGGWSEINAHFFKSSPEKSLKEIGDNFEIVTNSEDAVDRVAEGTFAFYENTYFLKEAILKRQQRYQENILRNTTHQTVNDIYDIVKTDRALHIMKDCIINLPVSLGLQKNSPIKSRVDKLVRRVLEAGLVDKWMKDIMERIMINKVQDDIQSTKAIMSLEKFSGALVALCIGYILGIISLIVEQAYFYFTIKRNPHFNKYSQMIMR